jgi:hypothetical protein
LTTLFDFQKHVTLIKSYFEDRYLTTVSIPEASVTGELKSMEQWWNGTDGGKVEVLGEQLVRVQIGPPQIPQRLTWN